MIPMCTSLHSHDSFRLGPEVVLPLLSGVHCRRAGEGPCPGGGREGFGVLSVGDMMISAIGPGLPTMYPVYRQILCLAEKSCNWNIMSWWN